MSNGKLRCWMRYSDSGKLYRTCKEEEPKMVKMIPQAQLDREFDEARDLVAKARALRKINEKRREMTSVQRELSQMADADRESAALLLRKFATPVGQEEPSPYRWTSEYIITPSGRKRVFHPPRLPMPSGSAGPFVPKPKTGEDALTSNLRRMGWTVQYSRNNPGVPYYFNTKTGERYWNPPTDPLLAPPYHTYQV